MSRKAYHLNRPGPGFRAAQKTTDTSPSSVKVYDGKHRLVRVIPPEQFAKITKGQKDEDIAGIRSEEL